jgi:hypothetical protein
MGERACRDTQGPIADACIARGTAQAAPHAPAATMRRRTACPRRCATDGIGMRCSVFHTHAQGSRAALRRKR